MRECYGDLWDFHKQGVWCCITTNGMVRQDGRAVMGRGVAYQAAINYPALPLKLGWHISEVGNHVCAFLEYRLFSFPVKYHWREKADTGLIIQSAQELMRYVANLRLSKVILPRPGCGNGKLDWHYVRDNIFDLLDDRVWVITNAAAWRP